jgi:hypothetical protein
MAQKDTQLLGEILNVQKAILSKMNEQEKKDKDKDKKGAKVEEAQVEAQGFTAMIKELQDLNVTAKQQLDALNDIKKSVGGMGTSGKGIQLNENIGDKIGSLGAGLMSLGMGILVLVGGIAAMALITPIVPMALIGAIGIGIIVYGFFKLFETLGDEKTKEKVDNGLESLYKMAGGVALFTLAVVASSLALQAVGFEAVGMAALVLMGFAGVFFIIGKGEKDIKDGAQAAMWMGLGMAAIGLGVLALVFTLKQAGDIIGDGGGSVLVGGLAALGIVAVAGVTFFILGQFEKEIVKGALAISAIGLGLAIFGLGLTVYLSGIAKIMGVGGEGVMGGTKISGGFFDTIGSMIVGYGIITVGAMALISYASIFALAGLMEFGVPLMIAAGAGAMALAGLSLAVFGLGLDYYLTVVGKHVGVSGEGSGMTVSAESFMSGVVVMGGAVGTLLGIGGAMALAGLASPLIGLGALAIGGAGLALASLGYGIQQYMDLSEGNGQKAAEDLKGTLTGLRDAFFAFVGEEGLAEQGILGSIGGLISGGAKAGTLAMAIASAMLIGPALSSIARGVGAWADLQNVPKITGFDKDGQPIYDTNDTADVELALENISEFLPKIVQPFIDLSNQANLNQSPSILSMLTGASLGTTPFSRGITAATGIGDVLTSIAAGLASWISLDDVKEVIKDPTTGKITYRGLGDLDLAIQNVSKVLSLDSEYSVIKPFVDLGSNEKIFTKPTSLTSLILGADLGYTPFEKGVQVSTQIGGVLTSIAAGVGAFMDLQNIPLIEKYDKNGKPIYGDKKLDIETAITQISEVLGLDSDKSVLKPFVDLGSNDKIFKKPGSLLSLLVGADFGYTPFEKGVQVSGQIGAVLSSMAAGISSFMNLQNIPRVKGYDSLGNPIYDDSKPADVEGAIRNVASVLDVDGGDMSILSPFITLAETVNSTKPRSILGWISEAVTGNNASLSPVEQGIMLGLQVGEIISNIGSGIGQMANLAAIPVINGYDENGRPTYGKPVNALNSVSNFGKIMGDLIIAFAEAAAKTHPYSDPESLEAIGPTIGSILGAVTDSLDIFSNPKKLKKIKGYDERGKPIYYENEFVDVDQVIDTMTNVVLKIIKAFGTSEVEDAMDNLDIDEDEMIGDYLNMFVKPISAFAKIVGELSGKGLDLYDLTNQIVYSTIALIKKFGEMDYDAITNMEVAGETLDEFSLNFISGFETIYEFDSIDPGFYKNDWNTSGSALAGVAANLSWGVSAIIKTFTVDNTTAQISGALVGSSYMEKVLENIKAFPKYMKEFLGAKPEDFGEGAKAAFGGLYVITTISQKDKEKRSHLKMFGDEMQRLANIATPFEKFTKSFGQMSKDMRIFAENFGLMDERGIMAFKEWTDSINTLSTANPDTFAANVVSANKAIDAGFGVGENAGLVDTIGDALGMGGDKDRGEKQNIINKNTDSGQTRSEGKQPQQKMPTAVEIGQAVAAALKGSTIDVYISGTKKGIKLI